MSRSTITTTIRKPPEQPEVKADRQRPSGFRSGGGITPDTIVTAPKLDDFEQTLLARGVFYPFPQGVGDFVRFYLGHEAGSHEGIRRGRCGDHQFRKFLDQQHIKYTEPDIQDNLPWLKWEIKREVFTTVFGLNEGYKVELQEDPQLQKAEEMIPQAKALYQNARKIVAERESGQTNHP